MKIKHFAGYGNVNAMKVKDSSCTLHIKVTGDHEYGIVRNDMYDLFNWLVRKFDKSFEDYASFRETFPKVDVRPNYENGIEACDYLFTYGSHSSPEFSAKDIEKAKEAVQVGFAGYGNGHSEYMVVNVDRDQFLTWAAFKFLEAVHGGLFKELIGGVSFEEGNGLTVARFSSCEKYGPTLNNIIQRAFPGAIVYGWGCWDSCYIKAPDKAYETELDETFADGENLRIDVKVTDKRSGCSFCVGDLICFDSAEDCVDPDDETYDYLTGLLDQKDKSKVRKALIECMKNFEEEEQ